MRPNYLVVCCANDEDVLAQNLLASPDIASGALPTRLIHGAWSAASAYAAVIAEQPARLMICVHQDVYLPAGYKDRLDDVVRRLDETAERWAVIGVYGAEPSTRHVGQIYDGSNGRLLGARVAAPVEVAVLDEVLIVVRADSGVNFDPRLPSFHLYETQIAMAAAARQRSVYVADLPIVHNSRSIMQLGKDYEAAWVYLSKHWGSHLPIPNLCTSVMTKSRWRLWRWRIRNAIKIWRGQRQRFDRVPDARVIARQFGFE